MKTLMTQPSHKRPQTKAGHWSKLKEPTQQQAALNLIQKTQMDKAYQFARLVAETNKSRDEAEFAEAV